MWKRNDNEHFHEKKRAENGIKPKHIDGNPRIDAKYSFRSKPKWFAREKKLLVWHICFAFWHGL